MSHLSYTDLNKVLGAIKLLNSGVGMETLAERSLKSLSFLVPSSTMTAFDGFDNEGDYDGSLWYSPPDTVPIDRVEILGDLLARQHPHYTDAIRTQEMGVFRISDGLPRPIFLNTELYNEFYRIFDGEAQIAGAMRISPNCLVMCSVHRPRRDFSDREMEIFGLLVPHLRAAFVHAKEFERLKNERKYLAIAVTRGIAVLDGKGELLFINRVAEEMLRAYFAEAKPGRLPESLQTLVREAGSKTRGGEYHAPPDPYRVKKEDSELRIDLVFDFQAGELTLLFEETAERKCESFRRLGLTVRESQVLYWMSKGKTDAEIALLCDIQPRTVEKHAEHLFVKLGVENRMAAVMTAIERLDR